MAPSASNFQFTVIGVAVLLAIGGFVWFGRGPDPPPGDPTASGSDGSGIELSMVISVHVAGAVVAPGVVTIDRDARVADAVAAAGGATWEADLAAVNLAAPVRDGERVVVPSTRDPTIAATSDDGIDLNEADATELTRLPGVGPVLAERIVGHRKKHGPFTVIEDLLDVPGIGEAKLAQLRDHVASP